MAIEARLVHHHRTKQADIECDERLNALSPASQLNFPIHPAPVIVHPKPIPSLVRGKRINLPSFHLSIHPFEIPDMTPNLFVPTYLCTPNPRRITHPSSSSYSED